MGTIDLFYALGKRRLDRWKMPELSSKTLFRFKRPVTRSSLISGAPISNAAING